MDLERLHTTIEGARDGDVRWEPAIDRNRQMMIAGGVAVVGLLTVRSLLHRRRRH